MKMSVDQISIISLHGKARNAETKEDSSAISADQTSTTNAQDIPPIVQSEGDSEQKVTRKQTNKASYWNLLHAITILGASTIALSPQLLIPRHNSIYFPESRHEIMILATAVCCPFTLQTMNDWVIFTKKK